MTRFVFGLSAIVALVASASSRAEEVRDIDKVVQPFLQKHCVECHDAEVQKGDFRVDNLSPKVGTENSPQWLEVMERINTGEMPPKKVKVRPGADESAKVVEWIAARMKEGESARMAARGRVSYNRLTRDEYVHTVRDLIGVHFDANDPGNLLEDPEWHGFERIGSVLTLSPSNIEKYLGAAETILDEAYPDPLPENAKRAQPFGGSKPAIVEEQINERHRERLRELGLLDKVRFEMWAGDIFRHSNLREPLPGPGIYEISYTLSGLKPKNGRAPRLKVYEARLDRVLFERDIVAPEDKPITVTFRAHLPKDPHIEVFNDVPGPSNNPRSGRHGEVPFISTKIGRIPWQMKLTDEAGQARYPFLILDSVSWKGPIIEEHERQLRDDYMPREEGNMQQARACLATLAKRAFRRPVADEEIDHYLRIVQSELDAKETFRNAVKAGMLAILNSKSFLFIAEGDENTSRHTLNDWEIASRLSYLLWNTMPDAELFALAEQGQLRDKAVLAQQVTRLLASARSQRFTDSFATQWLRLKKVGMFPPDKNLYPDYDTALEASMVGETKAFFREVLSSGLTLREFLHSDWSMMNPRLAQFYGLPEGTLGVVDEFQRVPLPADSHRGGLLTQASILSLTSDGVRHRPVHRGVWVMESIFGKSPPPPPANVNPIPTNPTGPKATLRQKLEAHINDASCAACHAKIDPLGLAFENYDAIGRWRTEEVTDGIGENPKVTAAGKLPDGRAYQTADEFKKLLVADLDAFNHTLIEKLATYGLRRSMSFDDRNDLKAIAAASKAKDYRVTDIVTALVTSDLFQKR